MSSTTFHVDAVYVFTSRNFRIKPDFCSLFDMDGTLVNSTKGVEGAWKLFADRYPGLDVKDILSCVYRS
jgi:hypothetical protein